MLVRFRAIEMIKLISVYKNRPLFAYQCKHKDFLVKNKNFCPKMFSMLSQFRTVVLQK